jgi:hypothetical protein
MVITSTASPASAVAGVLGIVGNRTKADLSLGAGVPQAVVMAMRAAAVFLVGVSGSVSVRSFQKAPSPRSSVSGSSASVMAN